MSISPVMTKNYEHEMPLRPLAKQTQSNPISDPADSAQIAQFAVVSVPLIQPVREVDLIKKGFL